MELTQDDVVRILKLIDESPMGKVSLEVGGLKLEVVKGHTRAKGAARSSRTEVPKNAPASVQSAAPDEAPDEAPHFEPGMATIKAPLLGTFYRRPQPGQPPYVEEGALVDEETTVALIEVMKLFNPVKAGVKGRIHKICVQDNQLVEYGQDLFVVQPE